MAKKPKNKFASDSPFSLAVCNRIRFCVGMKAEASAARKKAFEQRDGLQAQLAELFKSKAAGGAVSELELAEAKARVYDAIQEISNLEASIRFYGNTITETVQDADSPELDGLTDEMPLYTPPPPPSIEKPSAPKPRDEAARQEDHEHAEGVDEHLDASVNELDIPELDKGRLVKAGFTTIGAVAKVIDSDGDLGAALNVGEKVAARVKAAVQTFRSVHRKASAQVEREAVGA